MAGMYSYIHKFFKPKTTYLVSQVYKLLLSVKTFCKARQTKIISVQILTGFTFSIRNAFFFDSERAQHGSNKNY